MKKTNKNKRFSDIFKKNSLKLFFCELILQMQKIGSCLDYAQINLALCSACTIFAPKFNKGICKTSATWPLSHTSIMARQL